MFATFAERTEFAAAIRTVLGDAPAVEIFQLQKGLRLEGWPNYSATQFRDMLYEAGYRTWPGTKAVGVRLHTDENKQRFANVEAYASYVLMRAAYCAMDFGDMNMAAYVQDCFETATGNDFLGDKLQMLVRERLQKAGYRW